MASIIKRGGGYFAQVCVNGVRKSRSFRTKREASAWADAMAAEIREQAATPVAERHTLAEAMARYAEEVSPGKRGHRWEAIRIQAMRRNETFPSKVRLADLTPTHFAEWRDARLRQVQPGSVLREISLVSAILETARIEWQWIAKNPLKEIRRPKMPDHREVVISPAQVRALLVAMRYSPRGPVRLVSQAVAVCFLTALRTGMRAGELSGLTWDRVHEDYCVLPLTKTVPRKVPLTRKAIRLVEKMRDYDPLMVFGLNARSLDANFRKYRQRAGIEGVTFHDSRHTAATMLSRKLDVMDLCRMFGWTTTKMALVYYAPTASSIADLLNLRASK